MDAPYTGGLVPGGEIYAVDGNFTQADPCGPPVVYFPFPGDSPVSFSDIVQAGYDEVEATILYERIALGTFPNLQPFQATQKAVVLEQEFMAAQRHYQSPKLNTPYNTAWSVGWLGDYTQLSNCFLVEEGPQIPMGAGLVKIKRKYANLPPTRNTFESYYYTFPPLAIGDQRRQPYGTICQSRVQYDYFLLDQLDLFPSIPLWPTGHRLNSTTGVQPPGLIMLEQRYFKAYAGAADLNLQVDFGSEALVDADEGAGTDATIPSLTEYLSFVDPDGNNGPAELVIESSSYGPGPWLGNIYQRKTRFALAQ